MSTMRRTITGFIIATALAALVSIGLIIWVAAHFLGKVW